MQEFDVVIIGGGPIGIACGLEAKKQGISYIIIEKGTIVNSLFNYPVNMQFFSSSEKLEIDNIPFISKEAKPKRNEALEYYRRIVTSNQLNIHLFEKVLDTEKLDDSFLVKTNKGEYVAKNVVLATGFYDLPNTIDVPGEDLSKVSHYYNDPHFYASQKLAVIGASNSAIDAALECWRKGAEVTLIIRGPEVGPRVKYWVRPDIINRIEEGSIKAYYNSTVKEIKSNEIIIETPDGEVVLENDFVLALTGYRPNFAFLEKLGIALSDDAKRLPNYDPESMETNVEGLFLAGVICGGMETHKWFIENSRIHAPIIMNAIKRKLELAEQKA
ncbi:MAG: YpdA family putative bacillithiol disulfide reductase [Muricauda sp.]|jgi:thioredoxin reductase (NADPH)|nr:YpdA family putative bacillithiol disulfide reductase [Allomuricauda sp.]MBO6533294.1 YpdA family putative bacillithiol disulfide reductase [Allomuricauda sp.]MBO6589480.1 YpdA family putative bacillithiol disulfide reductase [Allomuricauda sp.]MBO6619088.1 YpdA family putative bacillithiol disulfide reductase [Allomuricauda sp.]MBO6645016.1 YpdA family putative bacillithiol disulfide reductase [Allomuricauda sp.]MBO6747209.1 YpdA family putative bacillithiol disulfide reductase [Allomurica